MFKATMCSPRSGKFGVQFYHTQGSEGPQDWEQPSFYLPCYSFEHAQAVTAAYANPPAKGKPQPIGELVDADIEQAQREGRHYAEPRK
jgi:hypothetical protein